jgi:hypothetical protein
MEKIKQNSPTNISVSESVVTSVCNKIIQILNNEQIKPEEVVVVLSQLLIYTGKSISKKDINFDDVAWEELEKEYYSSNKDNDLGLGLVLNGASIMQALNINIINDLKKEDKNVQVPTASKVSQKNRSVSSRSKTSSRNSGRVNRKA